MTQDGRLFLSAPAVTAEDISAVDSAMRSGWVAPAGPDLAAFESAVASFVGVRHAVGLSSGTAGLHLALKYVGVQPDDVVLVPSVTFAATAFAVTYVGGTPWFIDVERDFGTMEPELVIRALDAATGQGRRVAAAIPVDLYGTPVNYPALNSILADAGIPLVEDAAEGLGGRCGDRRLGNFGEASVLSFNGNKILTTSGGGMLLTNNEDFARRVTKWSTQSREAVPWYEHEEIGYNYRLSNLLAALGASQLSRMDEIVSHRRQVRSWYAEALRDLPQVRLLQDPPWGLSNAWLSVVEIIDVQDGPERIRLALEEQNIEARPVWKPMHQQPVFRDAPRTLNGNADELFARGLCLPSGPIMDEALVRRVSDVIRAVLRS